MIQEQVNHLCPSHITYGENLYIHYQNLHLKLKDPSGKWTIHKCFAYHNDSDRHMSLPGGDQELHNLFPQASGGTKEHGGPCCVELLSLQAGYTILIATQAKKVLKTEA